MMNTHTYKQVDELLTEIDHIIRFYDHRRYGLPLSHVELMDNVRSLVITKLGLTIMEDERILTIQKYTGCTRAQAQSLIDSGEF